MKKPLTMSVLGFVILGACVQKASAWGFLDHRCCGNICCKQYNAFSPFCCATPNGTYPVPGHGYGGAPALSFPGAGGNLGELPDPNMMGGAAPDASAAPPVYNGPFPNSANPVPGNGPQAFQQGVPPRPWPNGPAMMNSPGYTPAYPGFMAYGPANGPAAAPYYPGFSGYGPVNGPAAAPYYPGFTGYGPTNGTAAPPYYPGFTPNGAGNGVGRYGSSQK